MEKSESLTEIAISTLSAERQVFDEDYAGHSIKYRLLNAKEDLEASALSKKYKDTIQADLAQMTAIFALSVISVDGQTFYTPISSNFTKTCDDRWEIACTYYAIFISHWYENYINHLVDLADVFDNLKKKSEDSN